MPIEMPKGMPFSVDTWTPSSQRKRHHFLTHAHKDHAQGIISHVSYPIYSTLFTKTLILRYYPQLDESMFVGIEVGQSLTIEDPDGDFTVTAYDANHCPGSVMFLFEGNFGNILHTGDCRLTPECLQSLPQKYIGKGDKGPKCPLDCIFLDCTFGQFPSKMPSRHSAIQQVINCIWKHPDAPTVYLTCDMLGQEEILVKVSETFGGKIFLSKECNSESFKALELTVPESISEDPSLRFRLFDGFPKLYEKAEAKIAKARANFQKEPLIIRPSAQWYACNEGFSEMEKQRKERLDQAVRDFYGVWHVCYSIHSSREELEWALQLLAPKWVVSTTTSCRATELDYVKKHCLNNQQGSLWRLLDFNSVASIDSDVSVKSPSKLHVVKSIHNSCIETQCEPIVISTRQRKRLSLSPPSKRPSVTLFGRARLGLQDSAFERKQKEIVSSKSDARDTTSSDIEHNACQMEDASEEKSEELFVAKEMTEFAETKCSSAKEVGQDRGTVLSHVGLSKSYDENLRRFYRSRNVPVPQPLPSLVELMEARNIRKRVSRLRFPPTDKVPSSSYL